MDLIWSCPKCKKALSLKDKSLVCEKNHVYDISKKGYVHLLLANQKHNDNSGDTIESIEARSRFLEKGFYQILEDEVICLIKKYIAKKEFNFTDLACGEGNYTCKIHTNLQNDGYNIHTYGVDLSKSAILSCGQKKRVHQMKNIEFAIGNLSYLPILDQSVDIAFNCFAKFFEDEFSRILKKDCILIRVLPGKKHLWELKEHLYEKPYENKIETWNETKFHLIEEKEISSKILLSHDDIIDLIKMTPYFYKTNPISLKQLTFLSNLDVTISFYIQILRKN